MKSLTKIAMFAATAVLAFGPRIALAQVVVPTVSAVNPGDLVQDIPNGQPAPTNVYMSMSQLRSYALGSGSQHLAAPTLTTTTTICGGSTATVKGTDVSGQIAEGSSASTSCVVTFATPFLTAPSCFVSINNVTDSLLKCATSTTALTITKTSNANELINYFVPGLPGG